MNLNIPRFILRIADPLRRVYWKVLKPKTYGVKGLIFSPTDSNKIMLIRNSYGDTEKYTLPGGGYKPQSEDPATALRREIKEELGIDLGEVNLLGKLTTTREGKRDNLILLCATSLSMHIRQGNEVKEALWIDRSLKLLHPNKKISIFVEKALRLYDTKK